MNMKIGNPEDKTPATTTSSAKARTTGTDTAGKAGGPVAAGPQGAAPAEASTTVAFSSGVTGLLSGDKSVSGDFDAEKVERIAQAIADRKFEINAPAIADKLLANAREILSKAQH